MPAIAVLNNKIITTSDIYKFNINKKSDFRCLNCNKELNFRQARKSELNFTEHFYHPNNIKDTHIECEKTNLERLRVNDTWHNKLSNFIEHENREIIRNNGETKHIVDAYDSLNDMGIEFQNSPISVDDIKSRDSTTYLDWIFNVSNQYIRKVRIGDRVICEIPHNNWEEAVKVVKNSVYLFTGYRQWIILDNRESFRIQIENNIRNVWIGRPILFETIYEDTCLQNMLSEEGKTYLFSLDKNLQEVDIIYGRCKKSMYLLDAIHRNYVKRHEFKKNDVLAIKSVAGSGKTTSLLNLSKIHSDKKILYLAFNKALITDIENKIKNNNIKNLFPYTFDKILFEFYRIKKNREPNIIELTPQNLKEFIPWFHGKPFDFRKKFVELYNKFCSDKNYNTPEKFCNNVYYKNKNFKDISFLNTLWNKSLNHNLITFNTLRKLSVIQHWFKDDLDKMYDLIMIDETQDFDSMMLTMLLNDTKIPKIFVGDPKQSIYKWRGCINAFDYLPNNSLIIEFYSTFRIGEPACERIREKFNDCWMISKSKNITQLSFDLIDFKDEGYIYLFRSWRKLLQEASNSKNIWICNYEQQKKKLRFIHNKIQSFDLNEDEDEFPDDLPLFLKSLSKEDLEKLISNIDSNIVNYEIAKCKFYTVHSYKGLEDDNIRIANDLDEDDENLYYVAITRGKKQIVED